MIITNCFRNKQNNNDDNVLPLDFQIAFGVILFVSRVIFWGFIAFFSNYLHLIKY